MPINSRRKPATLKSPAKSNSQLPPDPEGLNAERAEFAMKALDTYQGLTGTDPSCSLGDLLNNLIPLCDRNAGFERFDAALIGHGNTTRKKSAPTRITAGRRI